MMPKTSASIETRKLAPMCRLAWYPLRRGVADLFIVEPKFRVAANERYLTALAAASDATSLAEEAATVCRAIRRQGERYRALNPFNDTDAQLIEVVNRGDWVIKGFRNRDLRPLLYGKPKSKDDQRRQAAKVTRRLALLHAHGLIAKVSRTHRWLVTEKGRRIITGLLAARRASTEQLIALAA